MATTLSTLRTIVDVRLGRQYNADDDGRTLLDLWINMAARYCWEDQGPLSFNESALVTGDATFPTITDDEFTLPTAFITLMELERSTGSGSANFRANVAYIQDGRTVIVQETGVTPTRMVGHSFWTELSDAADTLTTYIPDYLILELAAYFAKGETKNQGDNSPIQINSAFKLVKDWARKFGIRRKNTTIPHGKNNQEIHLQGGIYSPGDLTRQEDSLDVPYTVGR